MDLTTHCLNRYPYPASHPLILNLRTTVLLLLAKAISVFLSTEIWANISHSRSLDFFPYNYQKAKKYPQESADG